MVGSQNSQLSRDVTVLLFSSVTLTSALNYFCFSEIMTLKRRGELGLEEIYAKAPKGVTYTIVRPGGLTDGAPVGPKGTVGRSNRSTVYGTAQKSRRVVVR